MNDQEIKDRCAAITTKIIDRIKDDCFIDYMEQQCQTDLESLCREAMADAEVAQLKAEIEQLNHAYQLLAEWQQFSQTDIYQRYTDCRAEVKRLKAELATLSET